MLSPYTLFGLLQARAKIESLENANELGEENEPNEEAAEEAGEEADDE